MMTPGRKSARSFLSRFPTGPALDSGRATQFAVDASDAFDLAFGRKPLVKTVAAKVAHAFGPGRQPFAPAIDPAFFRFGVLGGQIGAHADHGLERDRFGDHIIVVTPRVTPDLRACLEKIAHYSV